ncbi:MAG: CehA/McbA family metallohydrolase [Proteobacteria bacterium]|nr:CehA/McbA family metallohydrolase [Pseudomonadota bacterium]
MTARLLLVLFTVSTISCLDERPRVWNGNCGDSQCNPPPPNRDPVDELAGEMSFWFGNLHSHSNYSDGRATPSKAFSWARDEGSFDFYAVSDHGMSLDEKEWEDLLKLADEFSDDGGFIAMVGIEWTHAEFGHVNVYGTESFIDRNLAPTFEDLIEWLISKDAIAQLNHPGLHGDFGQLELPELDVSQIIAIETAGYGPIDNFDGDYRSFYPQALDNGWKVAPTGNTDTHGLNAFGQRTVLIAPELTSQSLLEAMRQRRFYSTDDPDMEVLFQVERHWMGSTIEAEPAEVQFTIRVTDDEPVELLELVSNRAEVVATFVPKEEIGPIYWYPEVTVAPSSYYYLRVTGEDSNDDGANDQQMAVTAPIWFE